MAYRITQRTRRDTLSVLRFGVRPSSCVCVRRSIAEGLDGVVGVGGGLGGGRGGVGRESRGGGEGGGVEAGAARLPQGGVSKAGKRPGRGIEPRERDGGQRREESSEESEERVQQRAGGGARDAPTPAARTRARARRRGVGERAHVKRATKTEGAVRCARHHPRRAQLCVQTTTTTSTTVGRAVSAAVCVDKKKSNDAEVSARS